MTPAPVPAERDLGALAAGIDPLLSNRNLITRTDPTRQGPGFQELESLFTAERADPSWADGMEARILDRIARIADIQLVTVDAECRETICRVKLFYPPGTNSLASRDELLPIASQIGLSRMVDVVTIGDDDVPISLLYLQR